MYITSNNHQARIQQGKTFYIIRFCTRRVCESKISKNSVLELELQVIQDRQLSLFINEYIDNVYLFQYLNDHFIIHQSIQFMSLVCHDRIPLNIGYNCFIVARLHLFTVSIISLILDTHYRERSGQRN